MMNNLFSMFDPSTAYLSLSWLILLLPLLTIKASSHKMKQKKITAMESLKNKIKTEIKELIKCENKKGSTTMLIVMFTATMTINIAAIMPFNFTPTAHLPISLYLALSLWMGAMLNGLVNSTKHMMTHLTPMGTPTPLMNFMVVIETISQIIRPVTLSVRLTANMVAGHLLMSLLSNFSLTSKKITVINITTMSILLTLEMAVALIQAYVISILITLYYKESF